MEKENLLAAAAEYLDSHFSEIRDDIKQIKKLLQQKNESEFLNQFIPADKVVKELQISRKQFYNIRQNRLIGYHQVGRKIFVSRKSLTEYMEKHFIKPIE